MFVATGLVAWGTDTERLAGEGCGRARMPVGSVVVREISHVEVLGITLQCRIHTRTYIQSAFTGSNSIIAGSLPKLFWDSWAPTALGSYK